MKQKLIILAGITLLISLLATYWPRAEKKPATSQVRPAVVATPSTTSSQLAFPIADRQDVPMQIGSKQLVVEAVTTSESITLGLSGRSQIGRDGMLFVFQEPQAPRFWMKEMQFGLDLIWIEQGKVVDITENVPPPSPEQSLEELPTYTPKTLVSFVLEVPAGSVKEWGVKVGDPVIFKP